MLPTLPGDAFEFMDWSWSQIEPYYQELMDRSIDAGDVADWLSDWSRLKALLDETFNRIYVATTVDRRIMKRAGGKRPKR